MSGDEPPGGGVRRFTEASLLTVGGGALLMWGWAVNEAGGVFFCGLLVFSFLWQWFRGRDVGRAPSGRRLTLLAVLAAGTVLLFLLGR